MKKLQMNKYIKIGGSILAGTITYFFMYYGVLSLISTLFVSNTKFSEVKSKLINPILSDKDSYENILTNDFMYPAWDITNKKPLFFSTDIVKSETKDNTQSLYNMAYDDMILSSATNPTYFTSSEIKYGTENKTAFLFGGNTVASSPALYSHFLTSHFKKINTKNIQIVSVGAIDYAADKLTSSVGIVGWAERLYELTDPVKKYTQNYMIEHILRKNNQLWYEF
jgi:patatin-like phospholipase/acyl hydrolase